MTMTSDLANVINKLSDRLDVLDAKRNAICARGPESLRD
jgi:hypothetical protein